ncbi:hypothetical protein [Klebsiella oxytoca]|uniref:hypothetical protein n=1 Tax=Klebsiella oxytoca TaxID=571 RepID=UPI0025514E12|nr:hypothetical protein [Klebsiella oxytoca]MDK6510010.1 hypothetical protein [Klebsiella oxytoca]
MFIFANYSTPETFLSALCADTGGGGPIINRELAQADKAIMFQSKYPSMASHKIIDSPAFQSLQHVGKQLTAHLASSLPLCEWRNIFPFLHFFDYHLNQYLAAFGFLCNSRVNQLPAGYSVVQSKSGKPINRASRLRHTKHPVRYDGVKDSGAKDTKHGADRKPQIQH